MKTRTILLAMAAIFTTPSAAQPSASASKVDPALSIYVDKTDSVVLPDKRSIHFVCMGQGSPTVILTAGLGDWAISWSSVQPAIARTTRVCAWDRPGFGLSDAADGPASSETTTADLEQALSQVSLAGPYVLVGHSMGAYESLLFADRHPGSVEGMVLVDPTVPDQAALLARAAPAMAEANDAYTRLVVRLVRDCAAQIRKSPPASVEALAPDCRIPFPPEYPPAVQRAVQAEALRPGQAEAVASFYENVALSGRQAINPGRNYADLPLIVLTATEDQQQPGESAEAAAQAGHFTQAFSQAHDELAALSTRGINARVPGTGHYIHQQKPQVVIDAVNQVIAEARAAER